MAIEAFNNLLHDLKTPFSTIQLISRELEMTAPREALLLAISLNRISEMLLNFECQKKQSVPLLQAINCVVNDFRVLFPEVTIETSTTFKGHKKEIKINKVKFKRAIYNLVLNAVEAQAENIKLHVVYGKDSTVIKIEDDGIGMSVKKLEKALQGQSFKKKGSGLGLGHCRDFFLKNDASFEVSSKADQGTLVSIKF